MAVLFRAFIMLVFLGTAATTWYSIGPLPDSAQSMVNRLICSAKHWLGWERETGDPWVKSAPRFEPPMSPQSGSLQTEGFARTISADGTDGKEEIDQKAPRGTRNRTLKYRESTGKYVGGEYADQRLQQMLAQLRRIGAVDYRLEHWGSGGLFRFSCAMPLVGHQDQSRQFDAIDEDVLCAVNSVLSDVAEKRAESGRLGAEGMSRRR
jgi:hypothetical protein